MPTTAISVEEVVAACVEYLSPRLHEYNRLYSVRGILVHLGYDEQAIEATLSHCKMRGFTYCLDHAISHLDGNYPSRDACRWYPDQLHSRLECV